MKSALLAALLLLPALSSVVQAQTPAPLKLIPPEGHPDRVSAAVLTPDGKKVLSLDGAGNTFLWDIATGRRAEPYGKLGRAGACATFSPDNKTLYLGMSCERSEELIVIDYASGKIKHRLAHENTVRQVAVSPDGTKAAVGCYDNSFYLWDTATGKLLSSYSGRHGDSANTSAVRLSADGTKLLGAYESGEVYVWQLGKTDPLQSFKLGAEESPTSLSPDGKQALSTNFKQKTATLWQLGDTSSATALQTFKTPGGYSLAQISPDSSFVLGREDGAIEVYSAAQALLVTLSGNKRSVLALGLRGTQLVSGSYDRSVRVWKLPTGQSVAAFEPRSMPIDTVRLAPGGRRLALTTYDYTAEQATFRLTDTTTGKTIRTEDLGTAANSLVRSLAFSSDGALLLTGSRGDEKTPPRITLYDGLNGTRLRDWNAGQQVAGYITATKFAPNSKLAATASNDHTVQLWDVATGALLKTLTDLPKTVTDPNKNEIFAKSSEYAVVLAFTPDGKQLKALTANTCLYVWDVESGKLLRKTTLDEAAAALPRSAYTGQIDASSLRDSVAAFSSDTSRAIIRFSTKESADPYYRLALWDTDSGKLLQLSAKTSTVPNAITLSPDGKTAAFGGFDIPLHQLNGETLREEQTSQEAVSVAQLTYLRPNVLVNTTSSGILEFRRVETGTKQLALTVLKDGDWIAATPDGHFDGSETAISQVTFSQGAQTFALEQFAEKFQTPGLLARTFPSLIGGNDPPPLPAPVVVTEAIPPRVSIKPIVAAASASVTITVEATEQAQGGVKAIRLYQNGRLVGGSGTVRGIAVEAVAGSTTTKQFPVTLESGENLFKAVAYSKTDIESTPATQTVSFKAAVQSKPSLFVLSIGINTYKDATMNLSYARPDAEALAEFFTKPNALFAQNKVLSLYDADATREKIKAAITQITTQSKPDDVVFIYLAGHGQTVGDSWYFLPSEMRQMALDERVTELGLPGKDIEALVGKIPARKIVLVYDACKSGAAVTRGLADEQQALGVLARSQGIHILTASTGQQYATEVKELGHGILTYALLEGLNGKAANSADAFVLIRELMGYVENRVPELTRKYRGSEQYPVPFNRGQNFPLVKK